MHGTDAVSHLCKNGRVFLRSKNTVVSGSRMYRERALLGIMRSCRVCGEALYSLVQMLRL
ncbi:hypothetical protein HMPREF0860_1654 [Treponema socranskii subsp. socranskii VPI DR56BR1116 = ATCC 35536]|uniref:Uncharacterized protein n=1 Tax=Treponema socranskii subsp. socranskii VPI DR56BR1116 = ATCC 35536 TaxID=1125725 RepID=U1FC51_TRESO|nr:hypothetical protein HMPREF1325_1390 [Treponema socranskii subsp. socranskii VPI DR56BR1116 = ATCC 35536]ERK05180.1 hypothetical protein HMPREF0860_1654 [Treponema socranskii subsp. socranskii VPI DR56BR1116 = ATCC 35536]